MQAPRLRGTGTTGSAGRRHGRSERDGGQSLVEFAMVLPLFLLIVAGVVDFGMALYSNMTVINAAREGARVSITTPGDTSLVESRVRSMAGGLSSTDLTVSTSCQRPAAAPSTSWGSCTGTAYQSGDAVVVRVNYTYHLIWPLAFGTSLPLSSEVRMRIE